MESAMKKTEKEMEKELQNNYTIRRKVKQNKRPIKTRGRGKGMKRRGTNTRQEWREK